MNNIVYVNIDNLKKNINLIKRKTNKEIISVIKSNAYGLGAKYIYNYLKEIGVNFFSLVDMEEFLEIKEIIDKPVLIFNSCIKYIESPYIRYTINNIEDALRYKNFNKKIIVHLQVDTGMNRQGIRTIEEYLKILKILKSCQNIEIEGIYTHFSSDYLENSYYELQSSKFLDYLKYYDYKIIHTAASNSLNKHIIGNYVRIGISMYGLCRSLHLLPVICLKTTVINTFFAGKGIKIGYSMEELKEEGFINIIPLGYNDCADFYDILYKKGNTWYKTKIIGKSCMNHRFIYSKFDNLKNKRVYIKLDKHFLEKIDPYRFLVSLKNIKKIYFKTPIMYN